MSTFSPKPKNTPTPPGRRDAEVPRPPPPAAKDREGAPAARPKGEAGAGAARRVRPPVPDASHLESMGSLLGDLDAAFGAITRPGLGKLAAGAFTSGSASMPEVRELFSALAINHMRQVRDFMIGVRWGEAPREWAAICEPSVLSLVRAAREMEMHELCSDLEAFAVELARAASEPHGMLEPRARDALTTAYRKLSEHLPEVFALEGERDRREAIIVHALLQQVPEVRKLTIDRMYAAGLTSLDTLFLAKADEIAATTGIGEALAGLIVAKFAAYKQEAARLVDPSRGGECARLGELSAELRRVNERFEQVGDGWDEEAHAEKKRTREKRTEILLQIKVLLARLGEIDRIATLERLPYARKIENLEGFVADALTHAQKVSVPTPAEKSV